MIKHNHLAVVTVVALHQLIGFVWYSQALFLSPWVHGLGKEIDQLNQSSDPLPFAVAILASFLMAYGISWLVHMVKADSFKRGVGAGGFLWIGFAAPALATHGAFIGISWTVIAVDALHSLVLLGTAGGILAAWKRKVSTTPE